MPDPTVTADILPNTRVRPALSATSDMPVINLANAQPNDKVTDGKAADAGTGGAATAKDAGAGSDASAKTGAEGTGDAPAGMEGKAPDADKDKAATEGVVEGKIEPKKDETPAWMKAEITKERNRRRASDARAAALEQQVADLTRTAAALANKSEADANTEATRVVETNPRPKRETWTGTPEAFEEALIEWSAKATAQKVEAENKIAAENDRKETARKETEARAKEETDKLVSDWGGKVDKARETITDFDEVALNPDLKISTPMLDSIIRAENGVDVAYYLGKHAEEAERIFALPPHRQPYEMGRLAARIEYENKAAAEKAAAATVSKAAAPIKPLTNGNAVATDDAEPDMESYAAKRQAALKAQGRPARMN